MNFHDCRLPQFIEVFAVGQPEFATNCIHTISGREIRNSNQEYARQKYTIKNCRLSQMQFEQFNSFFRARRGKNFSFRFRDHADFQVKKQFIAKGNGILQQFALVKLYDDLIRPYSRPITKPVPNSVILYLNNQILQAEINYNLGIITLSKVLALDQILVADFIFDVAVRFVNDSFTYEYCDDNSIELSAIELVEVLT
jgi:uncharacterized protein (TIGR02217 family)